MKKYIYTLQVLFLSFFCLFVPANAQESTDWIEQNYPSLKKVKVSEFIENNTVIVLIAQSGNDYFIAQEIDMPKAKKSTLPVTLLNDSHKNVDLTNHSFLWSTYKKGVYLKESQHNIYIGFKYNKSSDFCMSTTKTDSKNAPFDIWPIEKYNGICLGVKDRCLKLNHDQTRCGMYTQNSATIGQELVFYIYRYDKSQDKLGDIAIKTEEGYGTLYSASPYVMPEGLTGYTITEARTETQDLTLNPTYHGGDIVPAQTALLIKGQANTVYPYYAPQQTAEYQVRTLTTTENLLHGTSTEMETPEPDELHSYWFYKLYYLTDAETKEKHLGFFWGSPEGRPFINGANKAYLVLPQQNNSSIRGFVLPQDEVTDIKTIDLAQPKEVTGIYYLDGRKATPSETGTLPHGFYIVNGKKVWIK